MVYIVEVVRIQVYLYRKLILYCTVEYTFYIYFTECKIQNANTKYKIQSIQILQIENTKYRIKNTEYRKRSIQVNTNVKCKM